MFGWLNLALEVCSKCTDYILYTLQIFTIRIQLLQGWKYILNILHLHIHDHAAPFLYNQGILISVDNYFSQSW